MHNIISPRVNSECDDVIKLIGDLEQFEINDCKPSFSIFVIFNLDWEEGTIGTRHKWES